MTLNQYLIKIEQAKAINLDRFIRCLPFADKHHWRTIYSAVRVSGGYRLTIKDAAAHQALYQERFDDRVSASKMGRSHDFHSGFAHVLVLNRFESEIPFVVTSTSSGYKTQGQLIGKQAVIIENIENFYRYREFLAQIGHADLAHNSDIIFGSGNQICHQLNRRFLSNYAVIYCAQDVELGGLTIFKTLKSSHPQCRWLAPPDWSAFKACFKLKPKNHQQLTKAIQLARELNLHAEADLINQTRHFMEQEAFLAAQKQD